MALYTSTENTPPPPRPGMRIGCVVSSYHHELTGAMANSAKATLMEGGMQEQDWGRDPGPRRL